MVLTHWLKNLLLTRKPNRQTGRRRLNTQRFQAAYVETLEERTLLTALVDFEDIPLDPESHFEGPDPDGTVEQGPFGDVQVGTIESGGVEFSNTYDLTFGSWSGFAVSNETDSTTPGFSNQFSAFPGTGAGTGADNYGLGFGSSGSLDPTDEQQLRGLPTITLPDGFQIESALFTNTTYAALSMRDGDLFAKQFGGPTGDDPDFFKLSVFGIGEDGEALGTEIEFYLADFRFSDNSQDYILDTWESLDLSALADARSLHFNLSSSDVGDFGMNTPAFFAIDNLLFQTPPSPDAIVDAGTDADDNTPDEFVVDIDGTDLIVTANGTEVLRQPLAETTSLTVNGSGDDDSFTVDQNDDLITIPITINGGSQTSGDTLTIDGGTFDTVTVNHDNLADGSVQLDAAMITFTGIEPLEVTGSTVTNLVLNLTDSGDATTFSVSGENLVVDNTNDTHGDDTLELTGVTSIAINAGAGTDTLTFQDVATTDYSGSWTIDAGTETNAYEILSSATVSLSESFTLSAGEQLHVDGELILPAMGTVTLVDTSTLSGSGRVVGNIATDGGGTVSPGETLGQLTVDGGFNVANGEVAIQLTGNTVGTEYDQIVVTTNGDTLDLSGAMLSAGLNFAPAIDDVFTILDNQTANAITGTFAGFAEGSTFNLLDTQSSETFTFEISYVGGDGNDVTLTVLEPMGPPPETEVSLAAGALTITDVNGGNSDDTLTLAIVNDNLRVTDPNNTLSGIGTGVIVVDANTIDIPLANITAGIAINTQNGTDEVTLDGAFNLGDNSLQVITDEVVLADSLTTTGTVTVQANIIVNQPLTVTAAELDLNGTVTGNGMTAVTLITDSLEIGGMFNDIVPTIQPLTPGTSIGLGGAVGTLNLTDAELANLGTLGATIGDASNTDTVTLETVTLDGTGDVTIIGTNIVGSAGVDLTTAGNVQFLGAVQPSGETNGEFGVDASSITFDENDSGLVINVTSTGTPAIDYDQLQIIGLNRLVNWNNTTLTVLFDPSYIPTDGDEFTIVNLEDAGSSSVGILDGLAEGDSIAFDGFEAIVSYVGGDGNDVTLTVQVQNQPPMITSPATLTTDEDTPLTFSTANNRISLADPDAGDASVSLTLTVSNGTLTLGDMSGATIQVTDNIDNLNTLLGSLVYQPTTDYFGSDTMTITVDDLGNTGSGGSQTATETIDLTVTPVNDAPTNTVPDSQSVAFLTDLVFSAASGNGISVADLDIGTGDESVEVTLSVNGGQLTLASTEGLQFSVGDGTADGTLTFSGSLSDINAALNGLSYRSNADFFGEDVLTVTIDDQAQIGTEPLTDTDTIVIRVAEPIIDSPLSQFEDTPIQPTLINGDFTNVVSGNFDGSGQAVDIRDDLFYWNPTTGANRLVLGDGSTQDSLIDPTFINGDDFFEMIAADLDNNGPDDLFFWNPTTGRNRLVHLSSNGQVTASVETNVVQTAAINGNDFASVVAGDLDGAGPDDLFFWHPFTGANRLIHLSTVAPGADTETAAIENDVVPRQMINGNDFQQIGIGQFVAGGLAELVFVNLETGANRRIELMTITAGMDSQFDQLTSNWIPSTQINGDVYSQIEIGDFDNNGLSDIFVWNPNSGDNRLLLTTETVETVETVDQPIAPSVINGNQFDTVTQLGAEGDLGFEMTGLFFWDSITGQNRVLTGELTTNS